MVWSRRTMGIAGGVTLVIVGVLLAFHPASRADSGRVEVPVQSQVVAHGPEWVPSVVTAPGLPVQCADGTWTRTVVRAPCWKHGGAMP